MSILIPSEVTTREGSVLAFRLVPYWDVRLDLLIVDQPAEHRTGAVGSIGDQARGFNPQPILNPIDHHLGGFSLFCSVGRRRLNVHDHSRVHVHPIISRVRKVSGTSRRCGPARTRIGQRDVLRSRADLTILLELFQILAHRTTSKPWVTPVNRLIARYAT